MSKQIIVTVRSDKGDLGVHLKYGRLIPGATLTIDAADYGDQLFEPLPNETKALGAEALAKAAGKKTGGK